MSSEGLPNPLLPPRQYRLSTIIAVMTVCAVLLASARLAPSPLNATIAIFSGVAALLLVAYMTRAIVRHASSGGGLFGGAMGTLMGGIAYSMLALLAVVAVKESPITFVEFFLGAWMFLMIGPCGMTLAAVFVVFGLGAGKLLINLRGRDDAWTGVACGAATGFAPFALFALPAVFFADHVDLTAGLIYTALGLTSTLVLAAYGGFGAAIRFAVIRDREQRRAAEAMPIDAELARSASEGPTPNEMAARSAD